MTTSGFQQAYCRTGCQPGFGTCGSPVVSSSIATIVFSSEVFSTILTVTSPPVLIPSSSLVTFSSSSLVVSSSTTDASPSPSTPGALSSPSTLDALLSTHAEVTPSSTRDASPIPTLDASPSSAPDVLPTSHAVPSSTLDASPTYTLDPASYSLASISSELLSESSSMASPTFPPAPSGNCDLHVIPEAAYDFDGRQLASSVVQSAQSCLPKSDVGGSSLTWALLASSTTLSSSVLMRQYHIHPPLIRFFVVRTLWILPGAVRNASMKRRVSTSAT